ncbi:transketolase domain-containing protein [Thecamonas trahens ATCC 50062]|uniref:Transketolase domain-containing protein n=1 Tax=Thecamonas trahens ATCC 50062 TaxID=461836 RepID=A0A0L0DKC9_THETB|nr:transketolase domain-containing protein [Thecamonas trahens ATCC 50062]KNC52864.1 transketolase domain-containing protein [Thecamonas trahens ATCC 50062]|eukprot:XP_013754965.1 transketolase domain-containing protein [Thecamonas trahens ATCC 50062]
MSASNLVDFDEQMFADVGFITAMNMVVMGNYAQTGHFGGPMSYTPANVALHLGLPSNGALGYDIRNPKHPFSDKFMLTGGHCIPTCYSLWMILYESMAREHAATGDDTYKVDPEIGMYAIDALGFRRSPDAVKTLLEDAGVADEPLFEQAKIRGIRALMGHSETTDVTNDVNGGPSGVGAATTAGKALFWDAAGAPDSLKIWALEGEFAFTEGHAQELKTIALAQQVGKRLRFFFSYNNAGIDDALVGGVVPSEYADSYNIVEQFTSYGWNVVELVDGSSYADLLATFKAMEESDPADRRPMVVIAHTVKGWWPAAKDGKVGSTEQIVSYPSHPYSMKMNSEYFVALAESFEAKFGVEFVGIRDAPPATEAERLRQFKTNIDVCLSVLDANDGAIRKWIAQRLVRIASDWEAATASFETTLRLAPAAADPFLDERLLVDNIPLEPVELTMVHPVTGEEMTETIRMSLPAGTKKGTRRAISEFGKWINYVTGNRYMTIAADLSNSINLENSNWTGHYSPVTNVAGTRLKAAIQEAGNACTAAGIASQTLSADPAVHNGFHAATGTYGAFTPLFYLPLRIFSQQNQDSPFALGTVTVIAGHSGPETAADARSHFGVYAPQCWRLFPNGHIVNLYFWDYNDVCPGYFAALNMALTNKNTSIIAVHVARPDLAVADRSAFADSDPRAAAKGAYVIREYSDNEPPMGTVLVQGCSSTVNLVSLIPRLEAEGINVRIVSVVSQELFDIQSEEYRNKVMPLAAHYDCMVVTTMTKTIFPLRNLGPLTTEYTLATDHDDRWRTGGLEPDVIAEAKLDTESIYAGVVRFARDRELRLERQRSAFAALV